MEEVSQFASEITQKAEDKFNPIALRKDKIVNNFGLSECSRVNTRKTSIKCLIQAFSYEISKKRGQTG